MSPTTPTLAGLALLLTAQSLFAGTLVSDGFETHTGDSRITPGPSGGIPFFTRNATGPNFSLSIADDTAGLGSKALVFNDTTNTVNTDINPIIGKLPQAITLASNGDFIQLNFRFRYTNGATATASSSGFRFGIYGSTGLPVTSDGQPASSDDDAGYSVNTGVRLTPSNATTIYRETGGTFPILGGADRVGLSTSGTGASYGDNSVHNATFKLTRGTGSNLLCSLSYDGGTAITVTDSASNFAFDGISFSDGYGTTPLGFAVDDINVMTNLVPEPASGIFLAIGAAGLVGSIRRRSR